MNTLLDRSVSLRREVTSKVMEAFGCWSYQEIQTPLLHFFDALKPGLDEDQIERLFRFVDRDGHLVVLRPDLTPVVAKIYAVQLRHRPLPLRVCYSHKVVRLERAFSQDQLEAYQIGLEHIGTPEPLADIEVILVAMEVLEALGLPDFQISLADHRLARHLLASTGAPSRIRAEVLEAIIARDRDEVRSILTKLGAREHYVEAVATLASLHGGTAQLDELQSILPDDRKLRQRLDTLRMINETFNNLGYRQRLRLQLGELAGASYYDGVAFSVVCEGAIREIGRGGRYDELLARYGVPAPACGFSLYAESVVEMLAPQHPAPHPAERREQAVAVDTADPLPGLQAALERRRQGLSAQLVVASEEQQQLGFATSPHRGD